MNKTLGIIGGLGPEAGINFTAKLSQTGISKFILYSDDRCNLILDKGSNKLVFFYLEEACKKLYQCGCTDIVICCNTAHTHIINLKIKFNELYFHSFADILYHQVFQYTKDGEVAIASTVDSFELIYKNLLPLTYLRQNKESIEICMYATFEIKKGKYDNGIGALRKAFEILYQQGFQTVILACTEYSLVIKGLLDLPIKIIDGNEIVVQYLVQLFKNET